MFEEPTSSRLALCVAGLVIGAILVSVAAFVLSTLPAYAQQQQQQQQQGQGGSSSSAGVSGGGGSGVWSAVETACVSVFTLEFLLRLACCPDLRAFARAGLNWVDFVAIAPYFIELAAAEGSASLSAGAVRAVRLVRIFRVFKIAKYLPWARVFSNAIRLSLQPLLMLLFVVMIACVLFSSAIFYAERGAWSAPAAAYLRADGSVSPFQSIPAAMWWCIVTMTTVGYGDMFPVTGLGRCIASLAALSGILVVAIPITIISTNFTSEYAQLEREKEAVRARLLLLRHQLKPTPAGGAGGGGAGAGGRSSGGGESQSGAAAAAASGLAAVLGEVEDLVRRNTQEFQHEVQALFDRTRRDLAAEVAEVVRLAFERRRQLHLQALSEARGWTRS
jgi:uncharacterized membrane protein YgcG